VASLIFQAPRYSSASRVLEPHERAFRLVGTPFRPQGRDPATGLDCLGLVICAFQLPRIELPTYRMTDGCWPSVEREVVRWFEPAERTDSRNNGLAIFRLPRSFHFGVTSGAYLVHADMALGRVALRRLPIRFGRESRFYRLIGAS
jgi:hypothetical protein